MAVTVKVNMYYQVTLDMYAGDDDMAKVQAYEELREQIESSGLRIGFAGSDDLTVRSFEVTR
jgi:hypothetical protein